MKISEFSVRRPITVLMVTLSVLVLGGLSLQRLPLTYLPEFSSSNLSVQVSYPSSSPQEVERHITRYLEEYLSTLNDLERISSTSSNSGANVRLEFRQGTNMDLKVLEVRDRVDQARIHMPSEVERVTLRRFQSSDIPVFRFAVAWDGDVTELHRFVDEVLQPRLERIDGVANVDIRGIDTRQILIEVDAGLMQAHGVDLAALSQSLRSGNLNVSGGFVIDGERKYSLRSIGEFQEIEEIENLPLMGGLLTLKDVATVRYDFPERASFSRLNANEAVTVIVHKASAANVVTVCELIREELQLLEQSSPFQGKLAIQVFQDQSQEILRSLNDLKVAGIYGGALSMIILFLFLMKVRTTLVISLAIPVSVVFTFAFMFLLRVFAGSDITINLVSLMGLMVAIGMLVDNSVVVLENIFRHRQEEGLSAKEAAIRGSREVGVAVLAATATTTVVFASFIFGDSGMSGRYLRDFGVAVAIAVVASLIVAVTLMPMLASRVFTGKERPKQRALVWLTSIYESWMGWLLRWRVVALVLLAALGYAAFALFGAIDRERFPSIADRQVRLDVRVERSYSFEEILGIFQKLEGMLLSRKDELQIRSVSSGLSSRTTRQGQYRGDLELFLLDEGNTRPTAEIQEEIRAMLPNLPGVEFRFGRMRGRGGAGDLGIEVRLLGEDPAVLNQYAEIVRERLYSVPGVRDVQTTLETGDDEIHLSVDRRRSEQLGISPNMVAQTVASALSTRAVTRFKTDEREVDVILQLQGGENLSLQELENVQLENRYGEMIPMSSLVTYQFRQGPISVQREERKAVLNVVANLDQGGPTMMTQMMVDEALGDLVLPPGYSRDMGRQWGRFQQEQDQNYFAIMLALLFMYIIMAALFESFIQPLTILFCVPFSLIGVAILFYLTGTTLNQMSHLGILVLFGIVVNNGIILVNYISVMRRNGLARDEAILKAGRDRLRPILMTACTSLFGLLPLTLPALFPQYFGAVQGRAGMWAPVSLAVLGGLTTSTFLTLIILPSVYALMDDLSRFLSWAAGGACRLVLWIPRRVGART